MIICWNDCTLLRDIGKFKAGTKYEQIALNVDTGKYILETLNGDKIGEFSMHYMLL